MTIDDRHAFATSALLEPARSIDTAVSHSLSSSFFGLRGEGMCNLEAQAAIVEYDTPALLPSESIAFLLCRRSSNDYQVTYLVQEVLEITASEYLRRSPNIASIAPAAMARMAKAARSSDMVLVMAHIHPGPAVRVEFSQADHFGNQKSFPFFHKRAPQPEHVALVWNSTMTSCEGIAYLSTGSESRLSSVVTTDGPNWEDFVPKKSQNLEAYSRQALLLGSQGQEKLSNLKVGIVGLGGLGSLTSMASIHHGIRDLLLLDDDVLGVSNLPRVVGAAPGDVAQKPKVEIAESYARSHAPSAQIEAAALNVEDRAVLHKLITCDVLISCTDNTTSRAFLTQFCNQYLVPLLDMGVQFSVDESGAIVNEIGRINLSLPGTACLFCTGHISPARLAAESVPSEERRQVNSYLRGIDDPQPSMMAFNMEVVGRGMQILVGYLSGLFPALESYELRSFIKPKGGSFNRQIAKRWQPTCLICGAGGVTGSGESQAMAIQRRAA